MTSGGNNFNDFPENQLAKFLILQVVQKQTLGEVGTWKVIWWPVVSGMLVPKTIRIWSSVHKLQSI